MYRVASLPGNLGKHRKTRNLTILAKNLEKPGILKKNHQKPGNFNSFHNVSSKI